MGKTRGGPPTLPTPAGDAAGLWHGSWACTALPGGGRDLGRWGGFEKGPAGNQSWSWCQDAGVFSTSSLGRSCHLRPRPTALNALPPQPWPPGPAPSSLESGLPKDPTGRTLPRAGTLQRSLGACGRQRTPFLQPTTGLSASPLSSSRSQRNL